MAQFRDAQPGGVQQFHHGPVPQTGRAGFVGSLDDLLDLLQIQKFRDDLPLVGGAQVLSGVVFDQAVPKEKTVEAPKGGQMARDGSAAQPGLVQMVEVTTEIFRPGYPCSSP